MGITQVNRSGGNCFSDVGITVLLAIIGVVITGILVIKNVKGNILWGILITWLLGIICQFTGLYVPNPEVGCYSLLPDFSNGTFYPKPVHRFSANLILTESLHWTLHRDLYLHSCL